MTCADALTELVTYLNIFGNARLALHRNVEAFDGRLDRRDGVHCAFYERSERRFVEFAVFCEIACLRQSRILIQQNFESV